MRLNTICAEHLADVKTDVAQWTHFKRVLQALATSFNLRPATESKCT